MMKGYNAISDIFQVRYPNHQLSLGPLLYPKVGESYIVAVGAKEGIVNCDFEHHPCRVHIHVLDFPHTLEKIKEEGEYYPGDQYALEDDGMEVVLFYIVRPIEKVYTEGICAVHEQVNLPFSVTYNPTVVAHSYVTREPHYLGRVRNYRLFVSVGNGRTYAYRTSLWDGDLTLGRLIGTKYIVDYVGRDSFSSGQVLSKLDPKSCDHGVFFDPRVARDVVRLGIKYENGKLVVCEDYLRVAKYIVEPVVCRVVEFHDSGPCIDYVPVVVLYMGPDHFAYYRKGIWVCDTMSSDVFTRIVSSPVVNPILQRGPGIYNIFRLADLPFTAIAGAGFVSPLNRHNSVVNALNLILSTRLVPHDFNPLRVFPDSPPRLVVERMITALPLIAIYPTVSQINRIFKECYDWVRYAYEVDRMDCSYVADIGYLLSIPSGKDKVNIYDYIAHRVPELGKEVPVEGSVPIKLTVRYGRVENVKQLVTFNAVPRYLICDMCGGPIRVCAWFSSNTCECVRCHESMNE
jgi:hypothetical protein